jgi:glycosyltransferase involved in cell wall biosynthesis
VSIKALCITEDADRPTVATFVALHDAGIELTVVLRAEAKARETLEAAGVRLMDLSLERQFDLGAVRALRRELEDGAYDLLHVFSNKSLQNGLIATRGLPIKIVAYRGIVGNVSFLDPVSWLRFLNPRIDRIVCVADAVRDYFLTMRPAWLRMPPERPVTIYKGHKLEWYTDAPADLTALGIPAGAFVIGCVANYRPRKGIEYLVEAVAGLPREWPVHLMLVGHMQGEKLDRAIAKSGIAERIHRVGHRPDAPALTAACDVFVLPSIKREGLARSLIEAMAYRVAPVVTDCGGSPELVLDGACGIVVPVRDAAALRAGIETLYARPVLRREYGEAARARIGTHFRHEDTVAQTLALYRSLVPDAD